jgi:hypothetical protein
MAKDTEKLKIGKGAGFQKTVLKRLRQRDETWEADFQALPKPMGQSETHYLGLVVMGDGDATLTESHVAGRPSVNDLAALLADAMMKPATGKPRRPKRVLVRGHHQWRELFPHLTEIGVEVSVERELPGVMAVYQQHLIRERDARAAGATKPTNAQQAVEQLFPAITLWVGGYLPPATVTSARIDPWAFDAPPPDGFVQATDELAVEGSQRAETCERCHGHGGEPCGGCFGTGKVACGVCAGRGNVACPQCGGQRKYERLVRNEQRQKHCDCGGMRDMAPQYGQVYTCYKCNNTGVLFYTVPIYEWVACGCGLGVVNFPVVAGGRRLPVRPVVQPADCSARAVAAPVGWCHTSRSCGRSLPARLPTPRRRSRFRAG